MWPMAQYRASVAIQTLGNMLLTVSRRRLSRDFWDTIDPRAAPAEALAMAAAPRQHGKQPIRLAASLPGVPLGYYYLGHR